MSAFLLNSDKIIENLKIGTVNYSPLADDVPCVVDYFSKIWTSSELFVKSNKFTAKEIFELIEGFILESFSFEEGYEEVLCHFFVLAQLILPKDGETAIEVLDYGYKRKNALNFLRIKNGYKEGTYTKLWKLSEEDTPKEDNTFLIQVESDIISRGEKVTFEKLSSSLQEIYDNIIK